MVRINGYIIRLFSAVALLWILFCNNSAYAQTGGILDSLFTFRSGIVKAGTALDIITRRTGYNFTYDSRLVNVENRVNLSFAGERLETVLDTVLKTDSLVYTIIDKYIIISRPAEVSEAASMPASGEFFYISGKITDAETKEPLPFATVSVRNKGRGTVTNGGGEFGLKIPGEFLSDTLSVSFLGYLRREIPVEQAIGNDFNICLIREFISIPEVIIKTRVPQDIIRNCINSIPENYGNEPALLTGFYREGVLRKEELQVYSEAILQIFKSPYAFSLLTDQVRIMKSRKIENLSSKDTLAIRLKAGLSTSLELDGMKYQFDFMQRENLHEYSYRITDIVSTDGGTAYVIDFEQREGIELPLFRGTLFINTSDYALLQADFELHPKYIQKMKESFVTSSSRGFDTWPITVKYSVSYHKLNGRYFLSHVRGDLLFSSKRKKKFFNTQFKVFFEMAVTGIQTENVNRFDREELAPVHSVFSKTITNYDSRFWGSMDFIKPEENLLQALKNMNVNLLEFSQDK